MFSSRKGIAMNKYYNDIKHTTLPSQIFLFAYVILYSCEFLKTTMYAHTISSSYFRIIGFMSLGIILLKIFFYDRYQEKMLFLILALGGCVLYTVYLSGYTILLTYYVFVIGAKGVSFQKIIKTYLVMNLLLIPFTIGSAQIGLIENLIYTRSTTGAMRIAFGFVYPTNFAAHIFFALLTYFYYKEGKIRIKHTIGFIAASAFLFAFCDTRLSAGMTLIILLAAFWFKKSKKTTYIMSIIRPILVFSVPLTAVLSILLSYTYSASNRVFQSLNLLLSSRLSLGQKMINRHGITLFGRFIEQHGNGGTLKSVRLRHGEYTYIDISYMRVMLMYGFIILIAICIFYSILMKKRIYKKDYLLPLCILLIAVNSMIEQHLLELAYNPFLLCFLAKLPELASEESKETIKEGWVHYRPVFQNIIMN